MSDNQEPSMEEILASIRKIISEDGETQSGQEDVPEDQEEDVLELEDEEPLELDDEVDEDPPLELDDEVEEAPLELEDEIEDTPADPGDMTVEEEETPPLPPPPPPSPKPEPAIPALAEEERIISSPTEDFGFQQFASLERSIRMGQAGETLEDIVKGLLKPMLRSWLDENLPGLVERLVQEEIQRMSHRARRDWDNE